MKRAILVISILVVSISSTFGQVDNSYKSTLKKMLQVAGSEETFNTAIKQMFSMYKQQKTNVPDSIWVDLEQEMSKTSIDDLVNMILPVYQKYLTEADLNGIIEFYQTPIGKKYAEKTPLIMQESIQVGQQWGMEIGKKFEDKLKKKGY